MLNVATFDEVRGYKNHLHNMLNLAKEWYFQAKHLLQKLEDLHFVEDEKLINLKLLPNTKSFKIMRHIY